MTFQFFMCGFLEENSFQKISYSPETKISVKVKIEDSHNILNNFRIPNALSIYHRSLDDYFIFNSFFGYSSKISVFSGFIFINFQFIQSAISVSRLLTSFLHTLNWNSMANVFLPFESSAKEVDLKVQRSKTNGWLRT